MPPSLKTVAFFALRLYRLSAFQVQKLHVSLVLIQDVGDDLLLGVAEQIVLLAAFAQIHFGAVVFILLL